MFQRGSEVNGRTGGWKKGEVMGRIMAGLFVALLCAAPLVRAQRTVIAEIPFPFVVRDMKCSPGEWSFVRVEADPGRVMIVRNNSTGESVLFLVHLTSAGPADQGARLTFYRYGDKHFLREVHEGNGIRADLMAGQEERKLQVAGSKPAKNTVLARLR